MKRIDISINQAKIESFDVTLDGERPRVCASIGLYAGTKRISSFSIDTGSWDNNRKFELPVKMVAPILKIAKQLEEIVMLHCNSALGRLTDGK